jgi:acetyltransferase-like isoleucine patch superfamily enzyme
MINIKPNYLSLFIRAFPNFLWPLKWFIIKKSLRKVGINFKFGYNSELIDHRLIEIGDNVFFGLNTVINTNVPVKIGNNVMFGRSVTIMGGDHNFSEVGVSMRFIKEGGKNIDINIENDVWVGSNVTILKGVCLKEGCVIGAGSIVTKPMPAYTICVGNPCKPLKCRFSKAELAQHLELIKSKYSLTDVLESYVDWNIIVKEEEAF